MSTSAELKEEGNAHFNAGRYSEAISSYTRAIELDPSLHVCFSNRCAAYVKLGGHQDEALQDAEQCIELSPSWPKGYSRKATALQAMGRFEDASRACEAGMLVAEGDSRDTLAKTLKACKNSGFFAKIKGRWHGCVSEGIGGYVQEFDFVSESSLMVTVLGRTVPGVFSLDTMQDPFRMDIVVQPPEVPPGAGQPAVPYIVRLQEAASTSEDVLLLCCPYMTEKRPTSFEGPGLCELRRGAAESKVDESLASLSEEERLLLCAKEALEVIPDSQLQEPSMTDSEQDAAAKVMVQVKFQSSMYKLETKFGVETLKTVFTAASEGRQASGPYGDVIRQLREKMAKAGVLDPEASASAQSPAPGNSTREESTRPIEASTPAAPAEPARVSTRNEAPEKNPLGSDSRRLTTVVAVAALGAVALGFALWMGRRRRS